MIIFLTENYLYHQMVMNLDKDNSINIISWYLMSTFNATRSINIPRETNWEWLLLELTNKKMLTTKIIFILLWKSEYLLNEYLQRLKHPRFSFLKLSVFLIQIISPVSVNIRTVATMLSLFDVPGITRLETSRRKKNWCHSKHQNTES